MAGEDPEFIRWLRLQPCALATFCGDRSGPPHHARHNVGGGQRAHDSRAIPLCPKHHDDFHDGAGPFLGWDRQQRRDWMDQQIERWNNAYVRALAPSAEVPF